MIAPWKKSCDKPRQHIEKQRHHFADKGPYSQSYGSCSSHVGMWELDHKEVCVLKNWCFLPVGLEKTLDSPLDSNEIKLVNPKGNQPWIFTGRTDVETEAPIPDSKSWLIGKDSDAGRDWGQEEKGTTEDEMAGWTWVWVSSGSWWWTGRPGVLQFVGSQRVGHDWATELNWSVVPCPVLTVASWSAYRFLKRQVRWSGIPSLSEFSTVYCDPHSQRLWHSQ